jgi:hypothetical protein
MYLQQQTTSTDWQKRYHRPTTSRNVDYSSLINPSRISKAAGAGCPIHAVSSHEWAVAQNAIHLAGFPIHAVSSHE